MRETGRAQYGPKLRSGWPTIAAYGEFLVAAAVDEVGVLCRALDRGGIRYRLVERSAELEQAIRVSRAPLIVLSEGGCDGVLRSRVRRRHADRLLVAWLPRSATARAAELLEEGAVEVLDATMGTDELLARLRNAAARVAGSSEDVIQLGPLEIDPRQGTASWDGADLQLTGRERELLQTLAEAHGETLRREEIYRRVWAFAMVRGDRAVDVNVKRLRDKLTAAGASGLIATQPGVGYRLELPAHAVTAL